MLKLLKRPKIRTRVTIPLNDEDGYGQGEFITFRNLADTGEHIAISFMGKEPQAEPIIRIHSECLTGDVFGSAKCDCGDQLQEAIQLLRKEKGILLYLRQEGRGIGLYNKLDAYALQAAGLDTYEANQKLGFDNDLRSYQVAAQMLRAMKVSTVRLLSNNPDKRSQLEKFGIKVLRSVSTGVFLKQANAGYLRAKVLKTAHRINLTVGKA